MMAFGKIRPRAAKRFQAFDLLSTLIAVVRTDGSVLFANAGLEDALGTSRRTLEGSQFGACFHEPQVLRTAHRRRAQQRLRHAALRGLPAPRQPRADAGAGDAGAERQARAS